MISIMLVDDHTLFRQGVASLVGSVKGLDVIAEASNGVEAINIANIHNPDIIVMDILMPHMDGITAAKRIKEAGNSSKIILLSMRVEQELIAITEKFISGYLVKNDVFDNLIYAIKAVCKGEKFISQSLYVKNDNVLLFSASTNSRLTKREMEIVANVANGHSNKEIATRLFISVKTVETHRANIMHKLNIKGVAGLIKYAIKTGIVNP